MSSNVAEVRTAHWQYARVLNTLRGICSKVPQLKTRFDSYYREALVGFDIDQFLANGCSLPRTQLEHAVINACERVGEYINSLPEQELTPDHRSINFQLNSELVRVALDGLSLHRPITVVRTARPPPPISTAPSSVSGASARSLPRPEQRCKPPRGPPPSVEVLEESLQSFDRTKVHYKGCPNDTIRCETCISAFSLLDMSPCSHKGDWCTRLGYYPHFTHRLQRVFWQKHVLNQAITASDLDAVSGNLTAICDFSISSLTRA